MKIKGFDKNLRCRGFQFAIGGEYKIENNGKPLALCSDTVFHYSDSLQNVHEFYSVLIEDNRFCEIEVLGEEVADGKKCGSDHIKVLREITGEELDILKGKTNRNTGIFNTGDRNTGNRNTGNCNTGNCNTGDCNTGNRNTGNCNTGDCNTGNRNTGDCNTGNSNTGNRNTGNWNTGKRNTGNCNTGNWNTGDWNTGNCNTGDWNTGDWNTGDWNTGDWNTGDWNTGDWNTGCFCTEEHKILFFDKETDITYREWRRSRGRDIMKRVDFRPTEWIAESGMTDKEKEENPTYKTTGGYLKERNLDDCYNEWWEELTEEEKEVIKDIPNFDADKFKQITGIYVEMQKGE